jgi:excisionase family DNA binding protein
VSEKTEPGTYSVPQAAERLGISRGYAFELAKRGELPGAFKVGGRVLVSRRVLDRVLDGQPKDGAP